MNNHICGSKHEFHIYIIMGSRITFSKQRAFILSDGGTEGNVGYWFPLSEDEGASSKVEGNYWSGGRMGSRGYYLSLGTGSWSTNQLHYFDVKRSVRYVGDITPVPPSG